MQNKNKIILMLCILFVTSCFDNSNKDYQKYSREIIGSDEYNKIHKQANDSIKLWHHNNLGYYQYYFGNGKNVKIDILCFNKAKNKLVTGLLEKHINNDAVSEGITFFYGAKIKDTWYFFTGAYIVLPREMYQSDIHTPLSFEKLHEIALEEVFQGYLKKKEPIVPFWKFWVEQEYEIDESWFDSHFDISDLGYDDDSQKRIFKQFKDSITQPFKNRDSFEEYYFKNISNPYLFK